MSSHFDQLKLHLPDLDQRRILDIGSGQGDFLLLAVSRGANAVGVEFNPKYIELSLSRAAAANLVIKVVSGRAEDLPFADESFDFLNLSELIEHVDHPQLVLREAFRVLTRGGAAYLSAPNRFGLRDPHFHIYLVNWLPRCLANLFLTIFNKHKIYNRDAGRQKLTEMHYYTYRQIADLLKTVGFEFKDIRLIKLQAIKNTVQRQIFLALYRLARNIYFDTFHLLLIKPTMSESDSIKI